MAVSESKHPTVVIIVLWSKDFHQSKVAMTFMAEAVGLSSNAKIGAIEGLLYGLDQPVVWDRTPAGSGPGCSDILNFLQRGFVGSAVKDQVRGGAFGFGWFEYLHMHGWFGVGVGEPLKAGK